MPRAGIRLARSALTDLTSIREWYAQEGVPAVGERLVRRMLDRLDGLADHPRRGRQVPEFEQPFLREVIVPPFRIVYRLDEPDCIRVVRVWRSERLRHLPDPEQGNRTG